MGWASRIALCAVVCIAGVAQAQSSSPRSVETAIELAWLSDPITFPYSLRAFHKNNVIEVHGQVPAPFVRKQALNIARLHSGEVKVLDQTDLWPASEKKFVAVSKDKILARLKDRVAKTYPQLAATIAVDCDEDGRVTLTGRTATLAEKMALNDLARATSGCVSAHNRVEIAPSPQTTGIQTVSHTMPAPVAPVKESTVKPSDAFAQPLVNENTAILREKLTKLLPARTQLGVLQTGPRRYQIQFVARSDEEANQFANLIFERPEWKHLRLDIGAHVPR